ncbi:hypothetical protein [Spiroplasma endosymbiont of Panorpa germanica]|uniref:hypothetical protein n=1 Tax=Spiroplasma endosymbiont of Panorpa germanica TaxID=3066314 RepID=UPI0030CED7CB
MVKNNTMKAAYILLLIHTILFAFFIIPLIWSIPITSKAKKLQFEYSEATGLGVCSILFMALFGIIAGILILTNKKENYSEGQEEIQQAE